MENTKVFKLFQIWFLSITSFDVLFISFLFVLGNYTDYDVPTQLVPFTIIFALISTIAGIVSIIYALTQKQPKQAIIGLGILFFSLILFLFSLIIGIASIY